MYVIIQLCHSENAEVQNNQMNFVFFIHNRKNCSKSIVQSISFYNELSIRNPVHKDGSRGKCLLEGVESIMTGEIKLSVNVLPYEACQWNNNV